jgi:hypothetical protein
MTRNLKALGLALVAAMAIGAIGAQGASAVVEHSFRSGLTETVLTGKSESYSNANHESMEVLTATEGLTVECYGTYEGKQVGQTLDEVTVHPKYNTCKGGVTVHTNGCNYRFDSDTATSTAHFSATEEHANATLECSEGHTGIEITRPGCYIFFPPQTITGIRYTNVTHSSKSALTVSATVRTIEYTVTSGSFCGLAGHGAGTYTTGKLDGKVEVTGFAATTPVSGSTTEGTVWGTHSADNQTNISISTPT